MLLIQILITVFTFFALARTFSQFQQGKVSRPALLFWALFWFAAVLVALLPRTADMAARVAGVGRGADLVIYLSLMALFLLVFRIFMKIEDQDREVTRLVRTVALERFRAEYRDRV